MKDVGRLSEGARLVATTGCVMEDFSFIGSAGLGSARGLNTNGAGTTTTQGESFNSMESSASGRVHPKASVLEAESPGRPSRTVPSKFLVCALNVTRILASGGT